MAQICTCVRVYVCIYSAEAQTKIQFSFRLTMNSIPQTHKWRNMAVDWSLPVKIQWLKKYIRRRVKKKLYTKCWTRINWIKIWDKHWNWWQREVLSARKCKGIVWRKHSIVTLTSASKRIHTRRTRMVLLKIKCFLTQLLQFICKFCTKNFSQI